MVSWDEIVSTVQGFFEWLSGLGAGFTDTLGELGSWLFGGLQWLGDRFKEALDTFGEWLNSGIVWLANKLKEAYETLASWISPAIQWIGSGLSWIGTNLYNFGQWLYNGITWVAQTAWNLIVSLVNWILEQLANAWNNIVNFTNNFVNSFNQTINNWVKSLRDKFKYFILINTTVPTVIDAYAEFVKDPSFKRLLGILTVPIFGAISAELIDAIVPRPQSELVLIYPPFTLPAWEYSPFQPPLPEQPIPPTYIEPITPPSVGFRPVVEGLSKVATEYELVYTLRIVREYVNAVKTAYELALTSVLYQELTSKVATEYDVQALAYKLWVSTASVKAIPEVISLLGTEINLESKVATEYEILSSTWIGRHVFNYVGTEYESFTAQILQLLAESLVHGYPSIVPSIGVSMEIPVSPMYAIDVYLPYETPPEEGGVGTEYEIQVVFPASTVTSLNKVATAYEIGGTVEIAIVEWEIYLGDNLYARAYGKNNFSEWINVGGIVIELVEPSANMFEDWLIY